MLAALSLFRVAAAMAATKASPKWLLNVDATPPYTQAELPASVVQDDVVLLTTWFGQMPCIGCAGHYAGTNQVRTVD